MLPVPLAAGLATPLPALPIWLAMPPALSAGACPVQLTLPVMLQALFATVSETPFPARAARLAILPNPQAVASAMLPVPFPVR
jgi:hypothetical protein